jgi:hypothetical protein
VGQPVNTADWPKIGPPADFFVHPPGVYMQFYPILISSLKRFDILAIPVLLLLAVVPQRTLAAKTTEIAFLEDMCEEGYGRDNSYSTRVRLAFFARDSTWKAFDHAVQNSEELRNAATKFAGIRQWFLVDHNKSIGKVTSRGVEKYKWYKDVGMQELVTELPAEAKGLRDLKYSGWPGCPVRKPIVLSTVLPASDKENWKKEQTDSVPTREMAEQIKNSTNDLYADDEDKSQKASFTEKDLIVVEQYGSLSEEKLIAIQFRPNAGVKDNTGDPDRLLNWFYVGKTASIKFIGHGLVLIDWADYNLDGQTEFLFWVDGYNLNGYLITWDSFRKSDSFTWNYH